MSFRPESAGDIVRHIHAVAALVVQADAACRSNASRSTSGSSLPRAEALRSIPRQAFGLKKYVEGTPACKICDKVDAFSSLGDSPELSIENAVSNAPSVSHVAVGIGPSCFFRYRHLGVRLDNTDDRFEDGFEVETTVGTEVNCTPFVRQYGILDNKWGALLCRKEYRTNATRRNLSKW